jgi:hypothetical protein
VYTFSRWLTSDKEVVGVFVRFRFPFTSKQANNKMSNAGSWEDGQGTVALSFSSDFAIR